MTSLALLVDLPSMIVPDQVVLADDAGSATYRDLRDRVGHAAGLLRDSGIGSGDRVAVLSTNTREAIELLFAPSMLGAVVVPMNFKASAEEATHLLNDSAATVLFAEKRYADLIGGIDAPALKEIFWLDDPLSYAAARDKARPVEDAVNVSDSELAVLLYTSGTTSQPKGVMLSHGALTSYVMTANDCADGSDNGRMLLSVPLHHVAGLTSLFNAMYSGRVVICIPQFAEDAWLRAVESHRVTHSFLVPTMIARLVANAGLAAADLSSLQSITYGGAPMPPPVIRRAIETFPQSVGFTGSYGQTETTATLCVLGPEDHRISGIADARERSLARLSSIGRPVEDVELRVVVDGQVAPPGAVGELQVRTARSMSGYWGKSERTRVTIDDDGWVHTGDIGYVDDGGYVFLAGRSGDMIIRGGENVAPDEVEGVLFDHPGVLDAGCVGVEDEEWGERIVAAVVAADGVTEVELLELVRSRLAPFKRPGRVFIVNSLPRNGTGKLLRKELRARLLSLHAPRTL